MRFIESHKKQLRFLSIFNKCGRQLFVAIMKEIRLESVFLSWLVRDDNNVRLEVEADRGNDVQCRRPNVKVSESDSSQLCKAPPNSIRVIFTTLSQLSF